MIEQILAYCGPYQAANIDDLRGHKGEGFECVLLKGERVIGTGTRWANDGPIGLDIPTENRDDLLAHAKAKHPDVQYEPEGIFMGKLWHFVEVSGRCRNVSLFSDFIDLESQKRAKLTFSYSLRNRPAAGRSGGRRTWPVHHPR